MNLRIARAFWMAQATQTWPFLLAGIMAGVMICLSAYTLSNNSTDYDVVYNFALFFSMAPVFIGLLYNPSQNESLSCRIPESTSRLPVSSFAIVFHRFVFNLTVVLAITLIQFGIVSVMAETQLYARFYADWWYWAAHMAGLIAFMQCVAILTSPTGDWAIGFLVATVIGYLTAAQTMDDESELTAVYVFLGFVPACLLIAWFNVYLIRSGEWTFQYTRLRPAPAATPKYQSLDQSFASPFRAQLWYEFVRIWRPLWRIFVISVAVMVLFHVSVLPSSGFVGNFTINKTIAVLTLLGQCGIGAALAAGALVSLQNRRDQIGAMSGFVFLRPMSTSQMGASRILAALYIVTLAPILVMVLVTAFEYFTLSPGSNYGQLHEPTFVEIATLVITNVARTLVIAWCVLWTWNLAGLGVVFALTLSAELLLVLYRQWAEVTVHTDNLGYSGIACIVVLVGLAFITAWRRKLIDRYLWILPILLLAAYTGWIYLWQKQHQAFSDDLGTVEYSIPIIIVVYMAVIAPIATVPLALHWTRHR